MTKKGNKMEKVRCKECFYWYSDHGKEGECRKFTPSQFHFGIMRAAMWAVTMAKDWCGEGRIETNKKFEKE